MKLAELRYRKSELFWFGVFLGATLYFVLFR